MKKYLVGTLEKLEESLRLMEHTLPTFFSGVLGIYKEDGKFSATGWRPRAFVNLKIQKFKRW